MKNEYKAALITLTVCVVGVLYFYGWLYYPTVMLYVLGSLAFCGTAWFIYNFSLTILTKGQSK
jgi:hypothetical protein